jgi:hypothetical protein
MPTSRQSDEAIMRDEETGAVIEKPPPCGLGPLEVTYLGRRLRVCTVLTTPADVVVRLDEMFPAFSRHELVADGSSSMMTVPGPRLHWQRDTEKTISPADDPIEGEGPCPDHPHKRHFIMVAR